MSNQSTYDTNVCSTLATFQRKSTLPSRAFPNLTHDPLSTGFTTSSSASFFNNHTLSPGNLLPPSRSVYSVTTGKVCRSHTSVKRGIDPHVDDPYYCHVSARPLVKTCPLFTAFQSHSHVPERDEDWPTLSEVVRYRDRVRERVLDLYRELESGKRTLTRRLARTLTMVLEHDAFHIEVRSPRYRLGTNVDFS